MGIYLQDGLWAAQFSAFTFIRRLQTFPGKLEGATFPPTLGPGRLAPLSARGIVGVL